MRKELCWKITTEAYTTGRAKNGGMVFIENISCYVSLCGLSNEFNQSTTNESQGDNNEIVKCCKRSMKYDLVWR